MKRSREAAYPPAFDGVVAALKHEMFAEKTLENTDCTSVYSLAVGDSTLAVQRNRLEIYDLVTFELKHKFSECAASWYVARKIAAFGDLFVCFASSNAYAVCGLSGVKHHLLDYILVLDPLKYCASIDGGFLYVNYEAYVGKHRLSDWTCAQRTGLANLRPGGGVMELSTFARGSFVARDGSLLMLRYWDGEICIVRFWMPFDEGSACDTFPLSLSEKGEETLHCDFAELGDRLLLLVAAVAQNGRGVFRAFEVVCAGSSSIRCEPLGLLLETPPLKTSAPLAVAVAGDLILCGYDGEVAAVRLDTRDARDKLLIRHAPEERPRFAALSEHVGTLAMTRLLSPLWVVCFAGCGDAIVTADQHGDLRRWVRSRCLLDFFGFALCWVRGVAPFDLLCRDAANEVFRALADSFFATHGRARMMTSQT